MAAVMIGVDPHKASPGTGHLLLGPGQQEARQLPAGEAVPDPTASVGALIHTGDHMARGSAQQLLRQAREEDRETPDQHGARRALQHRRERSHDGRGIRQASSATQALPHRNVSYARSCRTDSIVHSEKRFGD
jgi:hypothetical protein